MHTNGPSELTKPGLLQEGHVLFFHHLHRSYKTAKAAFRALLRKHQREQSDTFFHKLDVSDPTKLFRMVRRANGVTAEPTTVLRVDGCVYKDNELLDAWAEYFRNLATPVDLNYDPHFYNHVSEQYSSIIDIPLDEFTPFTVEEVTEVVLSLKLNKAGGPDNNDLEHLRYGCESLINALALLFNAIVSTGYKQYGVRERKPMSLS